MTLTPEIMQVYASAPQKVQAWFTVSFEHPSFTAPARMVHGRWNELQAELENGLPVTYLPIPFELSLPGASADGHQDLQITVCNIGHELSEELDRAIENPWVPISVFFRIYIDNQPRPHQTLELKLLDVNATTQTVTGTASRYDIVNRQFPSRRFRAAAWPGLVR